MQIPQEKRDLPFCEMGSIGQVDGEERKIKVYRLSQARLGFAPVQKVWRETTIRNVVWLWKHVFPKAQPGSWSICRKAGGGPAPTESIKQGHQCGSWLWSLLWLLRHFPVAYPCKASQSLSRLRLRHGADIGAGLPLTSWTALPGARKSNHWQR